MTDGCGTKQGYYLVLTISITDLSLVFAHYLEGGEVMKHNVHLYVCIHTAKLLTEFSHFHKMGNDSTGGHPCISQCILATTSECQLSVQGNKKIMLQKSILLCRGTGHPGN